MIRALQKKFIFSAMLAITILLVILLGAINVGSAYLSRQQDEQMAENLLNEKTMMQLPLKGREPKGFLGDPMDDNSRMSAVYFTVRMDQSGNIFEIDTERIASISGEEAAELCQEVHNKGAFQGKIQNFLYKSSVSERDGSTVYLFLDTAMQLHSRLRILFLSAIAGVACWFAMLLLVIFISKKAIRPIAENIARQKQFVTDAGHEIKTPLAIILANTEAMELYLGENKWSKNIREQTVRLNGLMQNLLTLAKAEEGRELVPMEDVSLSSVVSEALEMFGESMRLKELRLSRQVETGIRIRANKEQIQRLVSILLDNAVKYSVLGGNITVLLEQRGKTILFSMENTCEVLPECPPEKLFDRFYRADSARTQESGGYGLGLSAAKTIAELYRGEIKAAYHPPDRIAFTVIFS